MIHPLPGTYALVLSSSIASPVRIGKLGSLQLQPGCYVYVGSAHGPGGLRARLGHHLGSSSRPHWHIDCLRAHANPEEVWYCYDPRPWEHHWAKCIGMQPGASIPLTGFGASDCACDSHLYFFKVRPSRAAFARSLRAIDHRQSRRSLAVTTLACDGTRLVPSNPAKNLAP
jgi:Uri superfamily endonuclease